MLAKILTLFLFVSFSFFLTPPLILHANEQQKPIFTGTYWKLISLSNYTMSTDTMRREAHIVFSAVVDKEGKFEGALGCNDMLGNYTRDAQTIGIDTKHMAMTRLACPDMETEIAFIDSLGKAMSWKLNAGHLELMDNNGSTVATFEAVKKKSK